MRPEGDQEVSMTCKTTKNPHGNDTGNQLIWLRDYRKPTISAMPGQCSDVDSCRRAVTRAYRELRAHGVVDRAAFEAGVTLYRIRHPEILAHEARDRVAEWISEELGH